MHCFETASLAWLILGTACGSPPAPKVAEAGPSDKANQTQVLASDEATDSSGIAEPATEADSSQGSGTIVGKLKGKKKYRKKAVVYVVGLSTPPPGDPVTFDQKKQKFVPRVLPIVKGTTVKFVNNDSTGHNVFSPDHEKYDLGTFQKGETRTRAFDSEGVYTQLCKLHPSMLGYILSLPNRHFAVARKDGTFKIEGVPAGQHRLKVWHDKGKGEAVDVLVKDGEPSTVTIRMKK